MNADTSRPAILNVDDNETNRYVRSRILRANGFDVIEAGTGAEALKLVESERPDLVLLDVNLPDIDGVEVCRRIKETSTASVLVLQISAISIDVNDRVRALDTGADGYLVDPVEPEELVATVRALLRMHVAERDLRTALEQQQLLLRELNHRVKNNLQIVASVLALQATHAHAAVRGELNKARQRIATIAKVHALLHTSNDTQSIDFGRYLQELCGELSQSMIDGHKQIRLVVHAQQHRLALDQAIPLGLVVNELISNAVKHAFPGEGGGTIRVDFSTENRRCVLSVADDGCGMPAGRRPTRGDGIGFRLMDAIVRQLDGRLDVAGDRGVRIEIGFPMPPPG